MKKHYLTVGLCVAVFLNCVAQEFTTKASITYEKKENIQKQILINTPGMKEHLQNMPTDRITRYELTISGNKTIYRSIPTQQRVSNSNITFLDSKKILYSDYNVGKTVAVRSVIDEEFIFESTPGTIEWRIQDEVREIAGYNCRKAIGRFLDSAYVVAFYAEELIPQVGPEGFHGLPGTILLLASPRMAAVWTATKVDLAQVKEDEILPPSIKGKNLSKEELKKKIKKKFADFGNRELDTDKIADSYFKSIYFL
jgi:GLPGLI family protein